MAAKTCCSNLKDLSQEIRNGISGDDAPTIRIPRSKERPLVQEERQWRRKIYVIIEIFRSHKRERGGGLPATFKRLVSCFEKPKKTYLSEL
jgi:hypothetical protein